MGRPFNTVSLQCTPMKLATCSVHLVLQVSFSEPLAAPLEPSLMLSSYSKVPKDVSMKSFTLFFCTPEM